MVISVSVYLKVAQNIWYKLSVVLANFNQVVTNRLWLSCSYSTNNF